MYREASVGVKVTESVCVPAGSEYPAEGVYVNLPGTEAVALSCAALRGIPQVIPAGFAQVMAGSALLTTSVTDACAAGYFAVSVGVKIVKSVCVPAARAYPAPGAYVNVPGTDAVALS